MKSIVAYFSAETGKTAGIAKEFAEKTGAELFEIVPQKPYTASDLNWKNPFARCNREFFGKKDVPVAGRIPDFPEADTVFLGFPIWYACAPNVVQTFCKDYAWEGKRVYLFATSGGSGIGQTAEKLKPYRPGAELIGAVRIENTDELLAWVQAQ